MTLREAYNAASTRIAQYEDLRADAGRDAEALLLHALQAPRTFLFTEPGYRLSVEELSTYDAAIDRRIAGEPIQYIIGEQEFYGLPLRVTSAVLIPRPETELLVEATLKWIAAHEQSDKPLRILDVGTGSGAIAIALAKHAPRIEITAVDLSEAALDVALENAVRLEVSDRVQFLHSDLLDALTSDMLFEAIVSNPPYIPEMDRESLHRQVREYEPDTSLFAGVDGLEVYRRLIPQAAIRLKPGGLLAMEFGYGQQLVIRELLRAWKQVNFLDDLQGIPRVVMARLPHAESDLA